MSSDLGHKVAKECRHNRETANDDSGCDFCITAIDFSSGAS